MAEKEQENLDILEILLDEENDSPITLYSELDNPIKFDQVAIIPLEDSLYAILKPIDEMEGVADDEAIVFKIDDESEDTELVIETDESIAMRVFDEYYKLLDEEEKKQ